MSPINLRLQSNARRGRVLFELDVRTPNQSGYVNDHPKSLAIAMTARNRPTADGSLLVYRSRIRPLTSNTSTRTRHKPHKPVSRKRGAAVSVNASTLGNVKESVEIE